jgi:hypothetical protein
MNNVSLSTLRVGDNCENEYYSESPNIVEYDEVMNHEIYNVPKDDALYEELPFGDVGIEIEQTKVEKSQELAVNSTFPGEINLLGVP